MRHPFLRSHSMVSYGIGKPLVHSRQAVVALQDPRSTPPGIEGQRYPLTGGALTTRSIRTSSTP